MNAFLMGVARKSITPCVDMSMCSSPWMDVYLEGVPSCSWHRTSSPCPPRKLMQPQEYEQPKMLPDLIIVLV